MMTAVAFFVSAYSMTMPWYHFEVHVSPDSTLVNVRPRSVDYYLDGSFDSVNWDGKMSYSDNDEGIRDLMRLEQWLIFLWFAIGLAFIALCLLDNVFLGFIISWVLVGVCILAIIAFAALAVGAIFGPMGGLQGGLGVPDGFFGSRTIDGVRMSWGPISGFSTLVCAAVVQLSACFMKIGSSFNPLVRLFRPQ